MDLTQKKLSKSEWLNIEVPFPDNEKNILKLIMDGYHNTNICRNDTLSLLGVIKLEPSILGIEEYLYKEYSRIEYLYISLSNLTFDYKFKFLKA